MGICCSADNSTDSQKGAGKRRMLNNDIVKVANAVAVSKEFNSEAYIKADGTIVLPMDKHLGYIAKEIPSHLWIHQRVKGTEIKDMVYDLETKSRALSKKSSKKVLISRKLEGKLYSWNERTLKPNGVRATLVFLGEPEPPDIGIHLNKIDSTSSTLVPSMEVGHRSDSTAEGVAPVTREVKTTNNAPTTNEAPPAYGEA